MEMGVAVASVYTHHDLGKWEFFERERAARMFSYGPCRIFELLTEPRLGPGFQVGGMGPDRASRGGAPSHPMSRTAA